MDIFTYYFYTLASSTFPIVLCIVGFSPLSLFLDFLYSSFPPLRLSHSLFSSSLFIILGLGYDSLGFIFHFHRALFCNAFTSSSILFHYPRCFLLFTVYLSTTRGPFLVPIRVLKFCDDLCTNNQ
ncbi:hypothetical protein C8Q75DRAFT_264514 [Abortiporus biennis]|nr:hypothetical protein C8Q75DRAFT_264514 [Abortiporus biennis]